MKKIFIYVIIIAMLITMISCSKSGFGNREILLGPDVKKFKLNDLYAYTPYSKNGIIVKYEKNDIEIKAILKDKDTKKVIAIFGEYLVDLKDMPEEILLNFPESIQLKAYDLKRGIESPSSNKNRKIFNKIVYSEYILDDEAVGARLYCGVEYYKDDNKQNFTDIVDYFWESENDNYSLEYTRSHAMIIDNGTNLTITGGANLEKEITIKINDNSQYENGVHKTIKKLNALGFDLNKISSTRTTETYFIRYTINEFKYFFSASPNDNNTDLPNTDDNENSSEVKNKLVLSLPVAKGDGKIAYSNYAVDSERFGPESFAVLDKDIYFLDSVENQVEVFDFDSKHIKTIELPDGISFYDMEVLNSDKIVLLSYDGEVITINSSGDIIQKAEVALTRETDIKYKILYKDRKGEIKIKDIIRENEYVIKSKKTNNKIDDIEYISSESDNLTQTFKHKNNVIRINYKYSAGLTYPLKTINNKESVFFEEELILGRKIYSEGRISKYIKGKRDSMALLEPVIDDETVPNKYVYCTDNGEVYQMVCKKDRVDIYKLVFTDYDRTNIDNKQETSINKSPNQANGGRIDYDGERIYYINNGRLYSISTTGTDRKLLFDKFDVFGFKIYKDRIYLFSYSHEDSNAIYCIDKQGKKIDIIEDDDLHSPEHKLRGIMMYDDGIYYLRDNYGEDGMLSSVFKYDIEDKRSYNNLYILTNESAEPIEYNNKLYFLDGYQNDRLIEYDGESTRYVEFNKVNNHSEKYITSIQIVEGYIYYNSKNHISRDKLYEAETPEVIISNEDYMISSLNVTKEYIFYKNIIINENGDVTIQYNRMKHDGSEIKTIFEDKFNTFSNIGPMPIYIIDNLIFFRLWETYEMKVMDFDGNIIDWRM